MVELYQNMNVIKYASKTFDLIVCDNVILINVAICHSAAIGIRAAY